MSIGISNIIKDIETEKVRIVSGEDYKKTKTLLDTLLFHLQSPPIHTDDESFNLGFNIARYEIISSVLSDYYGVENKIGTECIDKIYGFKSDLN